MEFFNQRERMETAKSQTYSSAYVIYLSEFETLLKHFPSDFVLNSYIKFLKKINHRKDIIL